MVKSLHYNVDNPDLISFTNDEPFLAFSVGCICYFLHYFYGDVLNCLTVAYIMFCCIPSQCLQLPRLFNLYRKNDFLVL